MSSKFDTALNRTLGHEGVYNNDPRDRGGETYKGISRRFFPDWPGWQIVDYHAARNENKYDLMHALSADVELSFYVRELYYSEFFEPLNLDQFDEPIAYELFDTAVNQGKGTAGRYLQNALNLLNNNEKYYSDLSTDGAIGAATLKAYRAFMLTANFAGRSKSRNINALLKTINGLQFQKYTQIVEADPGQEVFFYGWLNRV